MAALYLREPASRRVELQLLPATLVPRALRTRRRMHLSGRPEIEGLPERWRPMRAYAADSMVQCKLAGDAFSAGFAAGVTLRDSGTVDSLRFAGQKVTTGPDDIQVTTRFRTPGRVVFEHILGWRRNTRALSLRVRCVNRGDRAVGLEMLASFSLGGISPFDTGESEGRLVAHRFRSHWSAEGRRESRTIEELHLERPWTTGHAQVCERFGQVGSMPVRNWFPFVAIEDTRAGVVWAAQLACPGSWQMEISRRGDGLCMSGGQADQEFGQWSKELAPGAGFSSPEAFVTVAKGTLETVCQRLTPLQRRALGASPGEEWALPIIFNDWCSHWGETSHDRIITLAERLKGTPVRYLVIDDGWAVRARDGGQINGDWIVDRKRFPAGLAATCAAIRARGLIPGIWFEFEVVTPGAAAWDETRHQLRREGRVLQAGNRRFWDFRDPWVHDYLHERVIRFVRDNGFGYLKTDYNEAVGAGCDGAESPGEGLRGHLEGVQRFFRRIRAELPHLVIENCSSGGHRLEPSMQALASMGSSSDAHETVEIPIIAANLHAVIHPSQSQVWAVARASDSARRLKYSLAATFLGRMTLSGDLNGLPAGRWRVLSDAMHLYGQAASVIRDGVSRRYGDTQAAYRRPTGWQAVARHHRNMLLVVAHRFGGASGQSPAIPLPRGPWAVAGHFGDGNVCVKRGRLRMEFAAPFSAQVALLKRG